MAIETQNGDYNLYASAATIYNKTAAADHDLTLEIRIGDGTKNLNTGVGTLTITVINDGGVEGGDSQVVYKGAQTRTVIRTGKLRVDSGKNLTVTAQSSNLNDTAVNVTVMPRWELKADSHGAAFSNLLFESKVVSYETSELGTALYIDGGPNQSGCFNRATVVVYDASNSNAPSFRQVAVSELDVGDTYLAVSSAFDFTPVEGDLVRVFINPREMALLPIYDPAKTAAQAGDEMALTASARTTLVAELEAEIADDATGEAVKQAIIAKLIENLPDLDDLSLAAIAEACATAILATPAYKLVTDSSGAVATDGVSRTASKNTASEIREAVGLPTANLGTRLDAIVEDTGTTLLAAIAEAAFDPATAQADAGITWNTAMAWMLAATSGKTSVNLETGAVAFYLADGVTVAFTSSYGSVIGHRTARTPG